MENGIDTMRKAIEIYEFATGGDPAGAATEWVECGFSASEAVDWITSGCYLAKAARELTRMGVTPQVADTVITEAYLDPDVPTLEIDVEIGIANGPTLGYIASRMIESLGVVRRMVASGELGKRHAARRKADNHVTERLTEISDRTAFDQGDVLLTEEVVRQYFTASSQREMFGGDAVTDQATLDEWAELVIENRWHMAPAEHVSEEWATADDERGQSRVYGLSASLVPPGKPGDRPRIEVTGTVVTLGPLGERLSQHTWEDNEPEWLTAEAADRVDEARLREALRLSLGINPGNEEGRLGEMADVEGESVTLVKRS